VEFNPVVDYPLAAAKDSEEFSNLLYLAKDLEYLELAGPAAVRVLVNGWRRLAVLRSEELDPDSAFVAMQFSDDTNAIYAEGIEPALRATGYTAIRVDLIEHNGKIDDRIVADIRRSSLVVADFTGHRQNVYFEAGFALGLGRHIIWTCNANDIVTAHFDTRQYNHVVWTSPPDLSTKLRNRIEATIPGRTRRGEAGR
jgi:hypothetical protein